MSHTIMVVDDSALIRMQVRRALTAAGFDVVDAKDGQHAFDALSGGQHVHVMVCDVNMPRMNGIELLEEIAQSDILRPVVLMLTTEGQPEMIQRARSLGAKGWIVKPFKADMLVATVRRLTAAAA